MDPDTLEFDAQLPDGSFLHSKEGKILHGLVFTWLNQNMKLEWHDVIEVKVLKPFARDEGNFVGFEIDRFHWAQKIGDYGYVRARWGRRPEDNDNIGWGKPGRKCGFTYVDSFSYYQKEFNPPCFNGSKHDAGAYYIPYSEEIWIGLEQMLKAIREIKLRLNEMLANPEQGHAYLAVIGANILKALPASVEQEE